MEVKLIQRNGRIRFTSQLRQLLKLRKHFIEDILFLKYPEVIQEQLIFQKQLNALIA
jgi:hypothetical protein